MGPDGGGHGGHGGRGEEAGATGPDGGTEVVLVVEGMHCPSCAALVREVLVEDVGVLHAAVDLGTGRATVRFDPAVHGVDDLCAGVASAGYAARPLPPAGGQ